MDADDFLRELEAYVPKEGVEVMRRNPDGTLYHERISEAQAQAESEANVAEYITKLNAKAYAKLCTTNPALRERYPRP